MRLRSRPNTKREIRADFSPADRALLVPRVGYGGNPEHKRNPGDFGLTPPAVPRPDKALCDDIALYTRDAALALLRLGLCRGLVSERWNGAYPQNIWSMTESGVPVEAQLENRENGSYHGYPLLDGDPFAEVVRKRWAEATPCGQACGALGCEAT